MFGEGFCHFFISSLHFWIKHYTIFKIKLNLYHSILLLLMATFTSINFSPQIINSYSPVLSYLAVDTATW
jgi:hypothetical protein